MTEYQKIILAAEKLASENELEGTTAYDLCLIGILKVQIRVLCEEKAKMDQVLDCFRMLTEMKEG